MFGNYPSTSWEHSSTQSVNPFGVRLPDGITHICTGITLVQGRLSLSKPVCQTGTPIYVQELPKYIVGTP